MIHNLSIDLDTPSFDIDAITKCVQNSKDVFDQLKRQQAAVFGMTLLQYFRHHPDALLYINGQVGEYSDEGYEGAFVLRLDPEHTKTIKSGLPAFRIELDGHPSSIQEIDSRKELVERQFVLQDSLYLIITSDIERLIPKEFAAFTDHPLLHEVFIAVGQSPYDSRGGCFWDARYLRKLFEDIHLDYNEMSQNLDNYILKSSVDLDKSSAKAKKRKQTL